MRKVGKRRALAPPLNGSILSGLYFGFSVQQRIFLQLKISLKTTSLGGIYSERQNGSRKGCWWWDPRKQLSVS